MKKYIFILFISIISQSLFAQSDIMLNYQNVDHKKIHFGFTLGFNTMDFDIAPSMNPFGADSTVLRPEINGACGFFLELL
jgi:hypothetical protein